MCVTSAGFIIVDFAWTVNIWRMKIDKGCQAFQDYWKLIKQFCTKKRDPNLVASQANWR